MRRGVYVCVQDWMIVHELRIWLERRVEGEEDLTVLLDGQMLDVIQPIWVINRQ
jgi:hypothetical protein